MEALASRMYQHALKKSFGKLELATNTHPSQSLGARDVLMTSLKTQKKKHQDKHDNV